MFGKIAFMCTFCVGGMVMAVEKPWPMHNVAHRGLWVEAGFPQNTVEAIRAAYEAGAEIVETDFVETESGEIICLHDIKALESMSSIVKEPRKITPADRARINLGEKLKLPRPYRIPLIKEVLAVVPKSAVLQAEIKAYGPTYADKFDAAVKAAGLAEKNIIVSSFMVSALKDFHARYPKYRTLWLGCGISPDRPRPIAEVIAVAKTNGFDIVCPGCAAAGKAGLTRADADQIRAAGLDFRLYGVNSPSALNYAAELRASGFTCNTHLAAYGWARGLSGVKLLPDHGALIPDDFKRCLSDTVKTVGVVMPASIAARRDYLRCKAWFEYAGYRVKEAPRLNFRKVAPVADRVADFEEMWLDPEVDLVFCIRGGTGAQDLVDQVNWTKLRVQRNTQRVLGFSNITWLLNTMAREGAGHPITGPSFTQFRYLDKPSVDWLRRVLGGEALPANQLTALRPGECRGLPCGGHIAILRGMAERQMLPSAKGRIVFLECSCRYPALQRGYLDRLLAANWFKDCAGIVFGDLTPGDERNKRLRGEELAAGRKELSEIRRAFAQKVDCPVFEGYPYGHVPMSFAVDFQREARISSAGVITWK